MNPDTAKLLEELAARLGTTTQYLWQVLVSSARVAALADLVALSIGIAIWTPACRWSLKRFQGWYDDDNPMVVVSPMVLGFSAIAILVIGMVVISESVTALLAPELWALNKITKMLKAN